MSYELPNRTLIPPYLKELKLYKAGKPIEELAREKGLTRISKLASNECALGPSPKVQEALIEALPHIHRYPDMNAFALKQSLANFYRVKPENIILGNGSEGIISYIVRSLVSPGDEVLSSEKTFIGAYILIRSVGARLKLAPTNPDDGHDLEQISKAITPQTKIIYLANPNNPTGTYFKRQEFDQFMEQIPDHVLVILDEAYCEYANSLVKDYPDSLSYRYDNVISLRTFSKAYGLAGLRCGYGIAHETLIECLSKVKLPFEPGTLAQVAAIAALGDSAHLKRVLDLNREMMPRYAQVLTDKLQRAPLPSCTNFITYRLDSAQQAQHIYESLLNFGVILRPLTANEMPEYLRISIAGVDELEHLTESLKKI